jgi:transcriptional regulator with XRE-family HTH domain
MEKESFLISLGANVKRARLKKGWSQMELAYRTNKDQPSINRLERGRVNPSLIYLAEIAAGLEIDLNELLKGIDLSCFTDAHP